MTEDLVVQRELKNDKEWGDMRRRFDEQSRSKYVRISLIDGPRMREDGRREDEGIRICTGNIKR
jgi:hypothetical protein